MKKLSITQMEEVTGGFCDLLFEAGREASLEHQYMDALLIFIVYNKHCNYN